MESNDTAVSPSAADRVDLHVDLATDHASHALAALSDLEHTAFQDVRGKVLNQRIGVHLKLAGVHADLALALAKSTATYTPPDPTAIKRRLDALEWPA